MSSNKDIRSMSAGTSASDVPVDPFATRSRPTPRVSGAPYRSSGAPYSDRVVATAPRAFASARAMMIRTSLFVFALAACGHHDHGRGDDTPDAAMPDAPDANPIDPICSVGG